MYSQTNSVVHDIQEYQGQYTPSETNISQQGTENSETERWGYNFTLLKTSRKSSLLITLEIG